MTIQDIKTRLSLQTVLDHYHIKVDRNGRALCPWHDDKTPSLQVYLNTNSWTCFSSNCSAGSGDQIDMIRLMESGKGGQDCTVHEAILKAKVLAGHQMLSRASRGIIANKNGQEKIVAPDERIGLLSRAFNFYVNALKQMRPAVEYLESRKLWKGFADRTPLDVGFNGGRFHYRGNLTEAEKQSWVELGMIKPISRKTYRTWAKDCVIFPLKNKTGQIVSFYGRSISGEAPAGNHHSRHFYHKNREGLYPHYPQAGVRRMILTEAVIDAASLMIADVVNQELGVLACYGTKGLTAEHIEAIRGLHELKEVIFFFDGDKPGLEGIERYAAQLAGLNKSLIISKVDTPDGEDVNSLHVAHESEIFTHLFENRTVLFMADNQPSKLFIFNGSDQGQDRGTKSAQALKSQLKTDHPEHLIYETDAIRIHIWGGIDQHNLGRLKVSLHIERKDQHGKSFRDEANLYSFSQVRRITAHISEALEISSGYVSEALADLTGKLENYRLSQKAEPAQSETRSAGHMTEEEKRTALELLRSPGLMRKTLSLIERAGLIGQQKNGMLLFLLFLTRYFDEPLHAIIYGQSGSGKTYTQTVIGSCVPEEDIYVTTGMTENTLYYSPKGFWKHKVLMIEDLEGVYQAFLPLRELMSKQEISKFTTDKDSRGNNVQLRLKVEGPVCVSGATTREWIYEDNANRSFLLLIDEVKSQLDKVMDFQRRRYAGLVDKTEHQQARRLLQNAQRLLRRDIPVINPYARELTLPDKVFKKLRTNSHYLELIRVISFYTQYTKSVKTNGKGEKYIESSIEDIEWANRLARENLLRKSDELGGKLRSFFEILKDLVKAKDQSQQSFYAKEIRQYLRMNPMAVNRHIRSLEMRGYIARIGGNRKTGYEYQIERWNDYEELQKGVAMMDENLKRIKAGACPDKSPGVAVKAAKEEV